MSPSAPPPSGDDRLFDWLRHHLPGGERLGDDAVVLEHDGAIAVSVDQQIEGVHFPTDLDAGWLARRLLEVCLSDLAATAARPRQAVLAMAVPAGWPHRRFLTALGRALGSHEMELVGGDTSRAERASLALWVLGDRPPRGRWLGRDGARPGDRLWIGGQTGWSALGRRVASAGGLPEGRRLALPARLQEPERLARAARRALRAHLAPRAQLELGRWLGRRRRSAAIDVSDGLALDLHRLCRAGGVGARIDPAGLTTDPGLRALAAALEVTAEEAVLGGGEDYVLLFALPASIKPPQESGAIELGRVTEETAVRLEGTGERLAPTGWSHLES